jgi:hypothetical protein
MAYTAEISRANPACFLLLVDQSGSMGRSWGGQSGKTKAQGVAGAINRLLQALVLRCSKGEEILDRYFVGVIGYGKQVSLGFPIEALAGSVLQPISRIDANPLRIEQGVARLQDGAGGWVEESEEFPVWFEPKAQGKTPMCAALRAAREGVNAFVSRHPRCFPPIVINITDGAATDGRFEPEAEALRQLASDDGNILLFNLHIGSKGEQAILFPRDDQALPDDYARRLFAASSVLPAPMLRQAEALADWVAEGARGFACNADLSSVVSFLDIGTRPDRSAR